MKGLWPKNDEKLDILLLKDEQSDFFEIDYKQTSKTLKKIKRYGRMQPKSEGRDLP